MKPTVLWFRQDLRVDDNAALQAARSRGGPVIPVYIWDKEGEGAWALGGASRWFLHHALTELDASLRDAGARLWVFSGNSQEVLEKLCRDQGADAVYWNRRYEPTTIRRDTRLKEALTKAGIEAKSFNSALLFEPHAITNKQGKPFQVFTAYWRHCLQLPVTPPVKSRGALATTKALAGSVEIESLKLLPTIPWDRGFGPVWTPGEAGAKARLKRFIARAMEAYYERRNLPAEDGTSMLSPWLHFGCIGPRQVWAAAEAVGKASGVFPSSAGARVYLNEIGWREFAHHLLFHFPDSPEAPLREAFARFEWAEDKGKVKLRAWHRGLTGYPIVDAGMRQLWTTGWMHNRVRMIVASFLVKHLRLPWQEGAAWFWDTLVDADLANNTLGWQWSAGCGADEAPYFRIFAPVLQGEKFDAKGEYVRTWVPELARVPNGYLHAPWTAPADILAAAGVRLGETYPKPIVDHAKARADALEAFKALRAAPV